MDRKRSCGCFHTFTVAFHAYFSVRLSKGFAKLHQKCCDKISNIRKSAGYPGDYLCRISGPTLLVFLCQVITSVPDMNAGDVSLAVDAANDAFQVSSQIKFLKRYKCLIFVKIKWVKLSNIFKQKNTL